MNNSKLLMDKISEAKKISFMQPDCAYKMSKEVYDIAKENNLALEEANALFSMALACRSMTKLKECYNYAHDALKIFELLDNAVGISGALNLIGVVYFYYAKFESALECFLRALNHLKEDMDYITLSRIYNNMGEVYREIEDFDEAISAYNKALKLCEEYNYDTNKAVILGNLGDIYFKMEEYEKSLSYYRDSYDILKDDNVITALAEVENRIGRVYFVQKDYELAQKYFNISLDRLDGINNRYYAMDVFINLAELEMSRDGELFLLYMDRAIKYGEEINACGKLSHIYKLLTGFYERKGDYELALEYHKRFYLMEREIEASNISKKLEIIKIELEKIFNKEELKKVIRLNKQLESDIKSQKRLIDKMEKANRNLNTKVFTDDLTGIYNRRGFNNHLSLLWKNGTIEPFPVAVMMIDIDYFKRYNDYHGHLKGDICLKKIAGCMKSILDKNNAVFGRYGGEEFICFFKNTRYEGVNEVAKQLCTSVEMLDMKYLWEGQYYSVTVSIGGAYGDCRNFSKIQDMYELADKELYNAKKQGRNRAIINNTNSSI